MRSRPSFVQVAGVKLQEPSGVSVGQGHLIAPVHPPCTAPLAAHKPVLLCSPSVSEQACLFELVEAGGVSAGAHHSNKHMRVVYQLIMPALHCQRFPQSTRPGITTTGFPVCTCVRPWRPRKGTTKMYLACTLQSRKRQVRRWTLLPEIFVDVSMVCARPPARLTSPPAPCHIASVRASPMCMWVCCGFLTGITSGGSCVLQFFSGSNQLQYGRERVENISDAYKRLLSAPIAEYKLSYWAIFVLHRRYNTRQSSIQHIPAIHKHKAKQNNRKYLRQWTLLPVCVWVFHSAIQSSLPALHKHNTTTQRNVTCG